MREFFESISSDDIFKKPLKFYLGFDPTADSLHIGNLAGIVAMCKLAKRGYKPFALVGGATVRIGDPSGKSLERPMLSNEDIKKNLEAISNLLKNIFRRQGIDIVIFNNEEWLSNFLFIDFLRDVGKHFRVGQMLGKESVRLRFNSKEGISFTEFSYQILQSYDFYYLFKNYEIELQIGGSDQWGNITAGIDFVRKMTSKTVYGMTIPLLMKSDGKKFGKSEEGAIWLSPEKVSPYAFYQYFVQVADADVINLMKRLTFLSREEIAFFEKELQGNPNSAQRKLAEEVTHFVHGEEGLSSALKVTEKMAPGSKTSFEELSRDIPHATLSEKEVIGQKFSDIVVKLKLLSSKSEACRLIKNGGAYVNDKRIEDPFFCIERENLINNSCLVFGIGKKKKFLIWIDKLID